MDVVKKKQHSKLPLSKNALTIFGGLLLLITLAVWANQSTSSVSVARGSIIIDKVKHGDLAVVIEGYGALKSDKQQLITTFSRATVKEIVLKPGATVKADSVIVELDNPELQQQLDSAKRDLAQASANLRQLKLNNQREKLNESAMLAQITADYETASLKKQAEQKLAEQGIVSKLNYQQTVLNEQQLKKRINILKQRLHQLNLVHEESVNIAQERVLQQQGLLDISQARLDKLTVRAGFDGVLQRLSVELGQSLTPGQEIALIGSVTDLIALIRVPQSQAQQIMVGQKAIVDTRRDKIDGVISRIDPIVADNTVEVEIALPKNLPASARPMLSVDGTITADTLKGVSYIQRPANVKANTQVSLYRINGQTDNAELVPVSLGRQAGRYIEITSKVTKDDQFIISDLSNLKTTSQTLDIKS
ncbi:efflux RND transporter periplasmic adaptor subunit [Psychrobium sp. 1_MG-2023]|uniref:efflux RND transporter periplasmic adaptor subunit n=1 Tax=Psychrobium sp. 1_MG-2023 TaxID=3062624 RepID=UPI000C34B38C|nr:HlyD family efflux transporter periplasmic adaptor subunit [Psychrobium sp. 1_MG-2023]MDP2562738.1 efflux RND transporter periplasmic adaptor subunit [Psychrobium sp. 1_MG-2023]PKF54255.1 RND transporter [Alteromonadales bacterium alter-6D02]